MPRRTLIGVAALCVLGLPLSARGQEAQRVPLTEPHAHVAEPAQAPSTGAVFREVPADLWRFVSLDTLNVVAFGGVVAGFAHISDSDFVKELEVSPRLNNAFAPGSKYGAFAVMLGASVAVHQIGRVTGRRHMAVVGGDLIRSQIVSQLWVQGLKFAVQRERPDQTNSVSFPSGHAASGFAFATVLGQHYGWKARIPAYIGAGYIAAARVHDNRHYLSDVTFGAAMGIAGARTVTLKAGRYGLRMAPAATPGGAALTVTVVPTR